MSLQFTYTVHKSKTFHEFTIYLVYKSKTFHEFTIYLHSIQI
jgi:hypothetical protein